MTWTWARIQDEWLAGQLLELDPADVVAAFTRAQAVLGDQWIEAARTPGVFGAAPTLSVAIAGQLLAALDNVAEPESLVVKLRRRDRSAWAELRAIHILHAKSAVYHVELEPRVAVGTRTRVPDFRARHQGDPWTYVEVTQPDASAVRTRLDGIMQSLAQSVHEIPGSYALEVFFRREPTEAEIEDVRQRLPSFCALEGQRDEELASHAGRLLLNLCPPGQLIVQEHQGEEDGPRLGAMQMVAELGVARHIAVRLAYSDERADEFLRQEARQLPPGEATLIMIDVTNTVASLKQWGPLFDRRLQPGLHTRVGGITLFMTANYPTERGLAWRLSTTMITNPHARHPLPEAISINVNRFVPSAE